MAYFLQIKYDKIYQHRIESIIDEDLLSFICEDSNDMNKFLRIVRDGMRLPINVCLAPKDYCPGREHCPYTDQT